MAWLAPGFETPQRVELATGHHLRPIRAADVDIDYPAVMGSRERLWAKFGEAWGWPPATMTYAQDRDDLARHEVEIAAQETFNYAVLDADESELLRLRLHRSGRRGRRRPGPTRSSRGGWSTGLPAPTSSGRSPTQFPAGSHDTWGFSVGALRPLTEAGGANARTPRPDRGKCDCGEEDPDRGNADVGA